MTTPDTQPQGPVLPETPHDPYAALRLPNFRWFAGGSILSALGHHMLAAAIGWEIYERNHSPLDLGYIGLARALPPMLLSLIGGHFADIYDRRKILIFTQLLFALELAGLAVWSHQSGPLWVAYTLLVLTGCTRAFNGPSRGSLMPLIIEPSKFHNAVTWNTSVFYISGIIGPIAAGWMYGLRHSAWQIYSICALFMVLFCIAAMQIKPIQKQVSSGKFTVESLLGGMSFVYRDKPVYGALLIDCLGVLVGGAVALLPAYAKDILKTGPEVFGMLKSAIFAGSFICSLILSHLPPFKHAGRTLLIAVVLWALTVICFGLTANIFLAFTFLFLQGFVDNISVVIRHVLVQTRTPDSLRGRVSAVNGLFIDISNELGAYESGLVADWLGTVKSIVTGGIGTLFVVAYVAATNKPLRNLKRIDPGADEQSPGSI